jgi:hypothetical protein
MLGAVFFLIFKGVNMTTFALACLCGTQEDFGLRHVCCSVARRSALWRAPDTVATYVYMMRILAKTPYRRRVRKTRRGIMIASALTVAAFVLTIAAFIKGTHVPGDLAPVAVERPISD